jgi:hypothetical protein
VRERRGRRERQCSESDHVAAGKPDPCGEWRRCLDRCANATAREIHCRRRHEGDGGEQPPRRIALPDVVDHLGRVDEVVHRHEVESAVELREEQELGHGDEQGAADPERDRPGQERTVDAPTEPPRTGNR